MDKNIIFTRRSVREFADTMVERDKIEKILAAAMQAPSAGNQRPWEFLVVEDKENLLKLSDVHQYAKPTANAPLAIVLLYNKTRLKFSGFEDQDMGACTQNLLLEVVNQGLGAVWMGVAPLQERIEYISKMYDLDENIVPFAVVAIGYPKNVDANKFVDRYESDRVHYEKY